MNAFQPTGSPVFSVVVLPGVVDSKSTRHDASKRANVLGQSTSANRSGSGLDCLNKFSYCADNALLVGGNSGSRFELRGCCLPTVGPWEFKNLFSASGGGGFVGGQERKFLPPMSKAQLHRIVSDVPRIFVMTVVTPKYGPVPVANIALWEAFLG